MANYTTKLRTLCEFLAGYEYEGGYHSLNDVIDTAIPSIFDFDFPIWDEDYRFNLEKKIIRHYFNYEIGQETPALFKFDLETRLNEIMPYYNELYKTTVLEFNPLYSVDYTVTLERKYTGNDRQDGETHKEGTTSDRENGSLARNDKTEGETTGSDLRTDNLKETSTQTKDSNASKDSTYATDSTESTTKNVTGSENISESGSMTENTSGSKDGTYTGHSTERFSDTPQGSLAGMGARTDGMGNIEADIWLTNATIKDKNESTHEGTTGSKQGSDTRTKTDSTSEDTTQNVTLGKNESGNEATSSTENVNGEVGNTGTQKHDTEGTSTENYNRSDTTTRTANGTTTNDGTTKKTGSYEKTDDYVRHVIGKDNKTDYGDLINKLRSAIINIDMMIITDLADCFMQIW